MRSGLHSRGYLPHVKREGAEYFLTFRLADSLPKEVLLRFEAEHAATVRRLQMADPEEPGRQRVLEEANRELLRKVERYLDQGKGACHLRRPEIARLVADALQFFNGKRYLLREWVVMPNHVHVLVWPLPNYLVSEIAKSWKQFTARQARRLLAFPEKRFWQPETYDHWIRSAEEREHMARYIANNPVKAGLCACPEDWQWCSAGREPSSPR